MDSVLVEDEVEYTYEREFDYEVRVPFVFQFEQQVLETDVVVVQRLWSEYVQ